jgi:DNA primase
MVSLEEYLLFLLSMKREGKGVNLGHLADKAKRDMHQDDTEYILKTIDVLVREGDVQRDGKNHLATAQGRARFARGYQDLEEGLKRINPSWQLVYQAKHYYPDLSEVIASFCQDRYIGFFCVFTGRHFFRRKLGKDYIQIRSGPDLLRLVDMHYVDVVPCVHRIGSSRPDWLVIDLDPGHRVSFADVKKAALLAHESLEASGLTPALKFSGSRGFQVWAHIREFEIPQAYQPMTLLGGGKRTPSFFSLFADMVSYVEHEIRGRLGGRTTSTVAGKGEREDKILVDASSMKEMGLVRSPYTIHHKTGLVSMPLKPEEVGDFSPEMAKPGRVLSRFAEMGNEFLLPRGDPADLIAATLEWTEEYNTSITSTNQRRGSVT